MLKHLVTLAIVQLKFKRLHAVLDKNELKPRQALQFISQSAVDDFVNKQVGTYEPKRQLEELDRCFQTILSYHPELPEGKRWQKAATDLAKLKKIVSLQDIKKNVYFLTLNIDEALKTLFKANNEMKHNINDLDPGMVKTFRWEHMVVAKKDYLFGYAYAEANECAKAAKKSGFEGKVFLVTLPISKGTREIRGEHGKCIQASALYSSETAVKTAELPERCCNIAAIVKEMRAENICRLLTLAGEKGTELFEAWNDYFKGDPQDKFVFLFRHLVNEWKTDKFIPTFDFETMKEFYDPETRRVMCTEPHYNGVSSKVMKQLLADIDRRR